MKYSQKMPQEAKNITFPDPFPDKQRVKFYVHNRPRPGVNPMPASKINNFPPVEFFPNQFFQID